MAQAASSQDKILKDKIQEVMKVLGGNLSKDKISMVLEYYDQDISQTVAAFRLDGAKKALEEWNVPDSKPSTNKKKKKKNKSKANQGESSAGDQNGLVPNGTTVNGTSNGSVNGVNGGKAGVSNAQAGNTAPGKEKPKDDYQMHISKRVRDRTLSEMSDASSASGLAVDLPVKGSHAGLEKSCRDLSRQTISLQRLRVVLNEHLDQSYKRVSEVFKEMHSQLNEREADLLSQLDKVRNEANGILAEQQAVAVELKLQTDRAQVMPEKEVTALRANIKQFVSERKVYEDICNSQRFTCDITSIISAISQFGEVPAVKVSRERKLSVMSVSSGKNEAPPPTSAKSRPSPLATPTPAKQPTTSSHPKTSSSSTAPTSASNVMKINAPAIVSAAVLPPCNSTISVNSARVLTQSESLTKYEEIELQRRAMAKLQIQQGDKADSSSQDSASRGGSAVGGGRGQGSAKGQRGGAKGRGANHQPGDSHKQNSEGDGDKKPQQGGRGGGRGSRSGGRGRGSVGGQRSVGADKGSAGADKGSAGADKGSASEDKGTEKVNGVHNGEGGGAALPQRERRRDRGPNSQAKENSSSSSGGQASPRSADTVTS